MVILKSLKNLLSSFYRDLGRDIYRIVVKFIGYMIVFLVIGFCATRCTKAMTITDNLRTIGDTQLELLKGYAKSSNYKYYFISSEHITSGYNNYTNYYLCLTNNVDIDTSSPNYLNTTCEEIYRYNNSSNNYSMTKINDSSFSLNNSVYYTNYNDSFLKMRFLLFAIFGAILFYALFNIISEFFGIYVRIV